MSLPIHEYQHISITPKHVLQSHISGYLLCKMSSASFKSSFSITHIGTATAIFEIDDVKLLTDSFFSPAGTS